MILEYIFAVFMLIETILGIAVAIDIFRKGDDE